MATHKPFREVVKPDSNFEFVGRTRLWILISIILVIGSVAMLFVNKEVRGDYLNWTIDFKGGTEIIFEFCGDPSPGPDGTTRYKHVKPPEIAEIRAALKKSGERGFEVSDFAWDSYEYCANLNDAVPTSSPADDGATKPTPKPGGEKEQADKTEKPAPKPAAAATKPAGKKPAAATNKPAAATNKPAAATTKPATDATKPATDATKPATDATKAPATDATKTPATDTGKTTAAGGASTTAPPATGDGSDTSGDNQPAAKKADRGKEGRVYGVLIRTPRFGAVTDKQAKGVKDALRAAFEVPACKQDTSKCVILKATWSGDRLIVRTTKKITWDDVRKRHIFKNQGLELKPWSKEDAKRFTTLDQSGSGEYNIEFSVRGLDRQFRQLIEKLMAKGSQARVYNVYGVGAKAGNKLRNDGIKSLFYAMLLIMLYLAFRFDIRYAPGAILALFHDALLVTGVFAVTWTDVSLTSVAALLTVIGYSVNDTVVIFDRIRENVGKLKDKKLARVINISLNETLERTLLTSATTFAVAISMWIFGTGLVANFAFALSIGIIVGTYSSVFIASPVFLYLDRRFYPPFSETKGKGAKGSKSGGRKKKSSKK